jgi:hypothetical protein
MGVCFMAKSKLTKWLTKRGQKQLYDLAYDAMTDKELCEALSITRETFYTYMRECVDFSDTVKRARADRDAVLLKQVQESFIKNKLLGGYKRTETRTTTTTYANGEQAVVEETKQWDEGPDTTAQIFYLKAKGGWQDKQVIQLNGGDEIDPFSASLMSALGKEPDQTEPDVDPKEVGDDDAGLLPEADGDF